MSGKSKPSRRRSSMMDRAADGFSDNSFQSRIARNRQRTNWVRVEYSPSTHFIGNGSEGSGWFAPQKHWSWEFWIELSSCPFPTTLIGTGKTMMQSLFHIPRKGWFPSRSMPCPSSPSLVLLPNPHSFKSGWESCASNAFGWALSSCCGGVENYQQAWRALELQKIMLVEPLTLAPGVGATLISTLRLLISLLLFWWLTPWISFGAWGVCRFKRCKQVPLSWYVKVAASSGRFRCLQSLKSCTGFVSQHRALALLKGFCRAANSCKAGLMVGALRVTCNGLCAAARFQSADENPGCLLGCGAKD